MPLTLLLGGGSSGKSALAVRLGTQHTGPVVFIATCPRIEGDNDLERRIQRHRSDPPDRTTDEEPHDLRTALRRSYGDVLDSVDQAVGTEVSPALLVAGRPIELRHSASYFPGDDQP